MSEKNTLRIHAQILPERTQRAEEPPRRSRLVKRRKGARKKDRQTPRHTIVPAKSDPADRLLRKSCIACAVLLGVLTVANIDQPWAKKAAEGIEQALTMRIDLDETIGELTFVRELMPESALVFLNITGKDRLRMPVEGVLSHPWNEMQPWLMFDCEEGLNVSAADSGTVTAVSPLSGDLWGVLIDHGNGYESVYAHLSEACVASGDVVEQGRMIGTSGEHLYFEWRINGEAADPGELPGL